MSKELVLVDQTRQVIGACFEVHNEKGAGFLEPVYHECLEIEFGMRGVPFESQPQVPLCYKSQPLRKCFSPDFVCFGSVVVEIKAVTELVDAHRAQMLNYLHATGFKVGLLVNFGCHPRLQFERFVQSRRSV